MQSSSFKARVYRKEESETEEHQSSSSSKINSEDIIQRCINRVAVSKPWLMYSLNDDLYCSDKLAKAIVNELDVMGYWIEENLF